MDLLPERVPEEGLVVTVPLSPAMVAAHWRRRRRRIKLLTTVRQQSVSVRELFGKVNLSPLICCCLVVLGLQGRRLFCMAGKHKGGIQVNLFPIYELH